MKTSFDTISLWSYLKDGTDTAAVIIRNLLFAEICRRRKSTVISAAAKKTKL